MRVSVRFRVCVSAFLCLLAALGSATGIPYEVRAWVNSRNVAFAIAYTFGESAGAKMTAAGWVYGTVVYEGSTSVGFNYDTAVCPLFVRNSNMHYHHQVGRKGSGIVGYNQEKRMWLEPSYPDLTVTVSTSLTLTLYRCKLCSGEACVGYPVGIAYLPVVFVCNSDTVPLWVYDGSAANGYSGVPTINAEGTGINGFSLDTTGFHYPNGAIHNPVGSADFGLNNGSIQFDGVTPPHWVWSPGAEPPSDPGTGTGTGTGTVDMSGVTAAVNGLGPLLTGVQSRLDAAAAADSAGTAARAAADAAQLAALNAQSTAAAADAAATRAALAAAASAAAADAAALRGVLASELSALRNQASADAAAARSAIAAAANANVAAVDAARVAQVAAAGLIRDAVQAGAVASAADAAATRAAIVAAQSAAALDAAALSSSIGADLSALSAQVAADNAALVVANNAASVSQLASLDALRSAQSAAAAADAVAVAAAAVAAVDHSAAIVAAVNAVRASVDAQGSGILASLSAADVRAAADASAARSAGAAASVAQVAAVDAVRVQAAADAAAARSAAAAAAAGASADMISFRAQAAADAAAALAAGAAASAAQVAAVEAARVSAAADAAAALSSQVAASALAHADAVEARLSPDVVSAVNAAAALAHADAVLSAGGSEAIAAHLADIKADVRTAFGGYEQTEADTPMPDDFETSEAAAALAATEHFNKIDAGVRAARESEKISCASIRAYVSSFTGGWANMGRVPLDDISFAFNVPKGSRIAYKIEFSKLDFLWRNMRALEVFMLWLYFSYRLMSLFSASVGVGKGES